MQQVGRPLDLYDRPQNTFVATFIGSPEMNLIDGELSRQDGGLRVRAGELQIVLPEGVFAESEQAVTLGIRPEHIVRASGAYDAEMDVGLVEQIGAQTYVLGTIYGRKVRAVFDRDDMLAAGDRIAVTFPQSRLHLFSHESGRTLRTITTMKAINNGRENHEQAQIKSRRWRG